MGWGERFDQSTLSQDNLVFIRCEDHVLFKEKYASECPSGMSSMSDD